jgi:hypothetical protein
MVQETMNCTGNLDGSGNHEWYRKPGWSKRRRMVQETWMVHETMNGTGNLDGSGDHEWYRKKPGWFRRP